MNNIDALIIQQKGAFSQTDVHGDEPLSGYVTRLAAQSHYYDMSRYVRRRLRMTMTTLASGLEIKKACTQLNIDPEVVAKGTPQWISKTTGWLDNVKLRREDWSPNPRYCAMCLAADIKRHSGPARIRPYARTIWYCNLITECPTHHVTLVDSKTVPLNALRQMENDKALEIALSSACSAMVRSQPAPLELSRFVASQLRFHDETDGGLIHRLPLIKAVLASEAVGAMDKPKASAKTRLITGFTILQKGESEFTRFLDRRRKAQTEGVDGDISAEALFGPLFDPTKQDSAFKGCDLTLCMADYAAQNVVMKPDALLLKHTRKWSNHVRLEDIARKMKVSLSMIEQCRVRLRYDAGRKVTGSREEYRKIVFVLSHLMSTTGADAYLKVPTSTIRFLSNRTTLKQRIFDPEHSPRFLKADLDWFERYILEPVETAPVLPPDFIVLAKLPPWRRQSPFVRFAETIRKSRRDAFVIGERRVHRLAIRRAADVDWPAPYQDDHIVGYHPVSRLTGLSEYTCKKLVALRLLVPLLKEGTPKPVFKLHIIEAFKSAWVSFEEIDMRSFRPTDEIRWLIGKAGIKSVAAGNLDFYQRPAIEALFESENLQG